MLNQVNIPIGRLRQAYRLNAQDSGVLISALASRGCVDLYELWHEAVRFIVTEENNIKSIYAEVAEPYFPDMSDMGNGPLEGRILTKRLLRHFLFSARGGAPRERLQKVFNRILHFTYDEPEQQQIDVVNRILDLIYEQRHFGFRGKDKVDIAWEYVSPELFAEFCSFFDDAMSANKEAAVIWLDEHGYSLERSVKGLSKELGERILATTATAQTQAASETLSPSPPNTAAIFVPRALWEGKTPEAVCASMRKESIPDEIIAYILYNRRKFKNKTEIGRLLGPASQEDSTCFKRTNRLLDDASQMNIVDS